MARVIIVKEKSPVRIEVNGKEVWICRCGLTDNPPYCSGAHKKTLDEEEGKLYIYEGDRRYEVELRKK